VFQFVSHVFQNTLRPVLVLEHVLIYFEMGGNITNCSETDLVTKPLLICQVFNIVNI
jgi:hypothetical protein